MAPAGGGFSGPASFEDPAFPFPTEGYVTILDLLNDALAMIRIRRAGDSLDGDTINDVLFSFNRILDRYNGQRRAVFNETFSDFTLVPNQSPHTIGPGGTFNVTQRPVSVDYLALNLGGSPAVYRPITIRDDAWYQRQPVPAITQSVPTDCYYSPDWPLGSLYFWGVPSTAYSVRIWTRVLLAQVSDPSQAFSLPPGYQDWLTQRLAKAIAPNFGQKWSPDQELELRATEGELFSNNDATPETGTADSGVRSDGGRSSGSTFNWRNRTS